MPALEHNPAQSEDPLSPDKNEEHQETPQPDTVVNAEYLRLRGHVDRVLRSPHGVRRMMDVEWLRHAILESVRTKLIGKRALRGLANQLGVQDHPDVLEQMGIEADGTLPSYIKPAWQGTIYHSNWKDPLPEDSSSDQGQPSAPIDAFVRRSA